MESQDFVVGRRGAGEGCKILVIFSCFAHSIFLFRTDPDINQSQVFTPFENNNENHATLTWCKSKAIITMLHIIKELNSQKKMTKSMRLPNISLPIDIITTFVQDVESEGKNHISVSNSVTIRVSFSSNSSSTTEVIYKNIYKRFCKKKTTSLSHVLRLRLLIRHFWVAYNWFWRFLFHQKTKISRIFRLSAKLWMLLAPREVSAIGKNAIKKIHTFCMDNDYGRF